MKPADSLPLLPAINNGWTFAAFVVLVALWAHRGRSRASEWRSCGRALSMAHGFWGVPPHAVKATLRAENARAV